MLCLDQSVLSSRLRVLAVVSVFLAAPVSVLARTITGVCPDGSIYIVQRAESIPCRNSKQVEPSDVPPINPEYLPRPYGWERFNQETDPNNPYNLVDSVRNERGAPAPDRGDQALLNAMNQALSVRQRSNAQAPAPPHVSASPPVARGLSLGLGPGEIQDLMMIVQIMQSYAPAAGVVRDIGGDALRTVSVARSASFESRVHSELRRQGIPAVGPVVLFVVDAASASAFYGNFTFVQGHIAFHPETSNPAQFGMLIGELGELRVGEPALGYAVLPDHVDLAQSLDIYWNDVRITATLRP
jgi:hypothetical protein